MKLDENIWADRNVLPSSTTAKLTRLSPMISLVLYLILLSQWFQFNLSENFTFLTKLSSMGGKLDKTQILRFIPGLYRSFHPQVMTLWMTGEPRDDTDTKLTYQKYCFGWKLSGLTSCSKLNVKIEKHIWYQYRPSNKTKLKIGVFCWKSKISWTRWWCPNVSVRPIRPLCFLCAKQIIKTILFYLTIFSHQSNF